MTQPPRKLHQPHQPCHPNRRQCLAGLSALGLASLVGAPAQAAERFPVKPIQLVLPFPPGGSFDPVFRSLAEAASRDLGQPVVLMHQPGAGGVAGTANLARLSEGDGYTLAVMHNSVIRAPLVQRVSWDPLKDFTYLGSLFGLVTGVSVARDAPWKTFAELMADAKARPGAISWGNVGAISINRISAERVARGAGTSFNMVSFKGGAEAFQALIGRHLDVYGDPGFGPQVQGGRARLLAVFSDQRLKSYPEVPTTKELGYAVSIDSPVGLVAPKRLPPEVQQRLHEAFRKAASDPAYLKQLEAFDMLPQLSSPQEYADYARAQYERDQKMLAEIGFKLD
ncbi:tripartite tricarboxylate transporter substrate binding protein [Curvibacter sp. RS43]|uniref:Tripartite tricarboxylate transporter substrate binding protein n=1 Tax=Curvibacter microcysteis TaxID=3026419 RepID=A0ABT5MG52_9BURK|nr:MULTISPECIES: tripartite tricarboxylate transporter substrate binding protein [unclassified Curvibacter]MDD0808998.1 tripartite tricarboxylate transporter substrate binding protein [Curvibacter sp. RS43]MDD0814066.1 tripartite tricarboxylate transporter substrate binding protein [Curvibacter sp. HBC28]